jgi:hypothetical protein
MRRPVLAVALVTLAAALAGRVPARADGPAPAPVPGATPSPLSSTDIDWQPALVGAFASAKKESRPLFIAINAERVDGKSRVEPAAKELRENTYHDPAVVKKSREFVCVLVRPGDANADYAELRTRFGIDGDIVSPQHLFGHADGTLISRKEYWSYGTGAASVDALIALMDAALVAHRAKLGLGTPGATGTAEEQRAAWIRERVQKIREGSADRPARDAAIGELVHGDRKGDGIAALCALLLEPKKDADTAAAIVRSLGKPGLEAAVPAVALMLDDTTDEVRSNAAVTLEYIGSATAIDPLTKRLAKEHDEFVRNNCCRALGRCGAKQEKQEKQEIVRKLLLRELATAKTNKLSTGPSIGLSYFTKDAEAARGIEKILLPGVDWQKRAFALYALTEIRDPKSAEFVQEKIVKTEKNQAAIQFLIAVAAVLSASDADGESQKAVTRGIESALGTLGDIGGPARLNRDQSEFTPNGEFVARKGRGR